MQLDKFIPEIQEQLRHTGFPRFEHGQMQQFTLQPAAPPKIETTDRFEFQNRDKTAGIVLTTNSVSLQTNSYTTFEEFMATAKIAFDAVLAEYQAHPDAGSPWPQVRARIQARLHP